MTQVHLLAAPGDVTAWKAIARREGRTLNGWLRWVANKAAEAGR